jgi:hypothetical protein
MLSSRCLVDVAVTCASTAGQNTCITCWASEFSQEIAGLLSSDWLPSHEQAGQRHWNMFDQLRWCWIDFGISQGVLILREAFPFGSLRAATRGAIPDPRIHTNSAGELSRRGCDA